ncbi:MAG: nitrate- and nitrite sensing domain-containing protein [Actinocrinis sp.]
MSNDTEALPRPRRRLSDLRLRNRLALLVLVPLIASVALATARVVTETDALTAEGNLSGQVNVVLAVSKLVHSVQDERDLISLFLTDGQNASDMSTLAGAENKTTEQVQAFESARARYAGSLTSLSASAQALAARADARLADLSVLRASVVSLGDTRPIFQAYTTIIDNLLNFSDQLATGTTDHTLGNLVTTLSLVALAGEQTSQERGFAVDILGGGGQVREQQEDLIQAQAQYNSAFASFTAQASPQNVTLFETAVSGQDTGNTDSVVRQIMDAALEQHQVSAIGVSGGSAFGSATAKIAQIRGVEQRIAAQALDRTSFLQSGARTQLYLNALIIFLILLLAFLATVRVARSIVEPLRVLRSSAHQIATVGLPEVIRRLRDAADVQPHTRVAQIGIDSRDEIGEVARAFDEVHDAAVRLASEQALLRNNVNSIFKNLSRRSQGLVERQLLLIDGLENSERDPGQLAQLFKLDHLATRMRRNNENLLVLAGEETARRWTEAVQLVDVARAAGAEVEQYERIMFGEIPRTQIVGKAAPDVAHLVAELLENATTYSSPQTKVWVAARTADDGGVILHIEDVGIGMTAVDIAKANERLSTPPLVDVAVSRQMGLFVVGRLAARYSVSVRLAESQAGGVTASIHLPVSLIDLGRLAGARPGQVPGGSGGGARPGSPEPGWSPQFGGLRGRGEPPRPPQPVPGFGNRPMNGSGYPGAAPSHFASNAAVYIDTPAAPPPINDPTWFAPKAAGQDNDGDQDLTAGVQQPPQRRATAPRGAGPALPAPVADDERLPIFEAVESEWFRRRGRQAPHTAGWSPRAAQPWDAAWSGGAEAVNLTQNPDTLSPLDAGAGPAASWSSPGDEAWRAAAALAQPTRDGVTTTGLPRRVPKANLVPGQAGANGAAKATPPPGLGNTAEAVRRRLSTFRRNSQQLAGEAGEQ